MGDELILRVIANLLLSMQSAIEAALYLIQERLKASEGVSARGHEGDVAGALRKVQEASAGIRTFGGRVHPKPGAEGSSSTETSGQE